ncbi:hypothetical protein [Ornithinibacillus sp. 179-J 7C1 HS]|uniref:hypothetical protein n=1 Tax=Ornithinibacillus sp. 179-J 7C1 HS TaxID=3142384 RepID=UPI0039A39B2B
MKTNLALIGAIIVITISILLDSPPPSEDSIYYQFQEDDESVDVDAMQIERSASSSLEFILEEMNEVNGKIVETYQEYEIHKDAEGNIISRIPTSNYQYIKYEKE